MSDFKKLLVWHKAHALALEVHRLGSKLRGVEHAAIRSQIVRAGLSIPTNIVEGVGQQSRKDFARFISIALNSTSELEYHLIVLRDTRLMSESDFRSLLAQVIEVRKMLHGLRRRVITTPRLSQDSAVNP